MDAPTTRYLPADEKSWDAFVQEHKWIPSVVDCEAPM